MTLSARIPALAIDGGGSRCRFLLVKDGVRHTADGGSANVSSDFDGAVDVLRNGVSAIAARAGLTETQVFGLPAFVGLAGVTGPAMIARLKDALHFTDAIFADDRPAALRGALGAREGAIAHCGTGSFFAAEIDGTRRLAGGWGPVLGDEASAQWVGRRLLTRTLDHVDGVHPGSPLTETVLARFGDAAGIVRFAADADPAAFGALAPLVTDAAALDDPTALLVMEEAAAQVAEGLTRIGWRPGLTVCLTGGIGPHYARYLPGEIQACLRPPKAEPIEGAIALALEHAEGVGR